jgi:hypothetical protein
MSDVIAFRAGESFEGPAVFRGGWLVDVCPTFMSAERIAAALNEAQTASANHALPAYEALHDEERSRVHRALMVMVRTGTGCGGETGK